MKIRNTAMVVPWLNTVSSALIALCIWAAMTGRAHAEATYHDAISKMTLLRIGALNGDRAKREGAVVAGMGSLFTYWYGTPWGLGAPQTKVPGRGKINCGSFVGRTLVDAGFNLNARKLQRQPAELIIKSLAPDRLIRRFRRTSMETFLAGVRKMGPGLYIIGLDFHVGYLLVKPDDKVRFIHASYITHTVLDEPAHSAQPIETSQYRVVGKLFSTDLLAKWRAHRRIKILGNW